ncbi:hypothetical protein ACLOJK_038154 [Asimina triloba]
MDLEKNTKKIQAPQHFEFVALASSAPFASPNFAMRLSVQLELISLQVRVRPLAVASVERNQVLNSLEVRRIPGSQGAASCY